MAFLALVFAMGGFAVAANQSATKSTQIKACYSKKTGELRVLKPKKRCKRSERALKWNKAGRRGPPGASGPEGPAGATGATGPEGPAGTDAQFNGAAAGGVLTGTFPNPGLADNALTAAQIAPGAVGASELSDTAITLGKLGLVTVARESPSQDSGTPKSATADCPAGTTIVGGAAGIFDGLLPVTSGVALSYSAPLPLLNGWYGAGWEPAPGFGGNWRVLVLAFCLRS